LGCARAVYGSAFNALLPLKALNCFEDDDLPSLPAEVKSRLVQAVESVEEIPEVRACSDRILRRDHPGPAS
jgi:hypothetical protein